jgi:hypothetical protein
MYVKIDSSNKDAVMQSSTDFFEAEPVGKLLQNQPVEMLDEEDGEYVKIRATVKGEEVEGWVKRIILQKRPLENQPRVSESGAVDSASFAAPGFSEEIEADMKEGSDDMRKALDRVDRFESARNRVFGGDAEKPDPATQNKNIRDFAAVGKLK